MTKKGLQNLALQGIDALGYRLDDLGVTNRLNRHNLSALVMLWQWRLQGEKDRAEIRLQRYRRRAEPFLQKVPALSHEQ